MYSPNYHVQNSYRKLALCLIQTFVCITEKVPLPTKLTSTSSSHKAHTHDLFVALQMLKLENIYTYSVGIFMYKLKK